MKEAEMEIIGGWIDEAITGWNDEGKLASIKMAVKEMTDKFPLYPSLIY